MQNQVPTVAQELFSLFKEDPIKFIQQADKRILETKNRHGTAHELAALLLSHVTEGSLKGSWTRMLGIDYMRRLALEYGLPTSGQPHTLISLVTAAGIVHRFPELVEKVLGSDEKPTQMDIITLTRAYCDSSIRSPQTETELKALITKFCSERTADQLYGMKSEDGRSWMLETPPKKKVTTHD